MAPVFPTFLREARCYLHRPAYWTRLVFVALGGYGAALAIWELRHADRLEAFVFQNDLLLAARTSLAVGLLIGTAATLLLWAVLGLIVSMLERRDARRGVRPDAFTYARTLARLLALGIVLPLLPVLFIPGIATRAPLFTVAAGAAVSAAVFLVARSLRSDRRPREPDECGGVREDVHEGAYGDIREGARIGVGPYAPARIGLVLTILLVVCYTIFMTSLSAARHNAYLTNAFDLGIYDQSIYNILHSGYLRTTLFGPYAINHLGEHFSPALYLLAPIYAFRQDARTLLALQSLLLATAAIPLYLLARLETRSIWIALALVLAWLLHPALHGVNLDDFHQIALAPVFVLSALYFLETDRDVPFLVCLLLALFVKEEMALTVVAVGAYVFLGKKRRLFGAALALSGLLYFGVITGWVMPKLGGTPQIDTRFSGFMAPGTNGVTGMIWTLLTNPLFTAAHILGNPEKMTFLLQVFLPVIFLPLLAPPVAWLLALPALAIQTLTDAHTQYDINGHYTAHLLPLLFFLATLALGRIRNAGTQPVTRNPQPATRNPQPTTHNLQPATLLAVALIAAALSGAWFFSRAVSVGKAWPQEDAHDRVVDEFVARIPQDASVSTLGGIVPHLTTRKTIYLFPIVGDAEYLLLDTSLDANYWPYEGLKARDQSRVSMAQQVRSGEFGLLAEADGVYLFQRGRDVRDNEAALRKMLSTRYEAEAMRSDVEGPNVPDPAASGGQARLLTPGLRRPDGKAAAMYGPYTDLQPGNYRATFVLKGTGVPASTRALTLDVFTHKDGYPRAVREIYGRDLGTGDAYRSFALDFNTGGQTLEDVEFRVMYDFVGEVSLDRVDVEYLP